MEKEITVSSPVPSMELVAIREILAEVFGSGCWKADELIRFPWTASQK